MSDQHPPSLPADAASNPIRKTIRLILLFFVVVVFLGVLFFLNVPSLAENESLTNLLLFLLTALVITLGLYSIGTRFKWMTSLFWKQFFYSFLIALLTPVCAGTTWALLKYFYKDGDYPVCLIMGTLFMTALVILVTAREFTRRYVDPEWVSKQIVGRMEIEQPIINALKSELGGVSNTFNLMTELLQKRIELFSNLFRNIRIFSTLLNQNKILDHTVRAFKDLEDASEIVVALLNHKEECLEIRSSLSGRTDILGLRFKVGEGLMGKMLVSPQTLNCSERDYAKISANSPNEKLLWDKPTNAIAVPMVFKDSLKGVVLLYNCPLNDISLEEKLEDLQMLADQIAIFLENADLYNMVAQDRLTGLYVHSFIESELGKLIKQSKRYNFQFSFLMFDVDHFKQINDTYGHAAGNLAIQSVAQTMLSISRESDFLGRFGGDEFEIILPHTDKNGALRYAEKLRKAMEATEIQVSESVKIKLTISVGVSVYPEDAQDAAKLHDQADQALYKAKAEGRNRICSR